MAFAKAPPQIGEQLVGQPAGPQTIDQRPRPTNVPAYQVIDTRLFGLQFFKPIDEAFKELLRAHRRGHLNRLSAPSHGIGRHKPRCRSSSFIDGNNGATVRARFIWPAALRRSAKMRNSRFVVDCFMTMPAAEGQVMNAVTLVPLGIVRAVGDANRK
jgi:hypothetical protein